MGTWDVGKPDGSDLVNTVDDTIKADKVTLRDAIGAEHKFEASDTSGYHLEGSARIHVVANDGALPATATQKMEGRTCYVTGNTKLYYADGTNWKQLSPKRNIVYESWYQGNDGVTTSTAGWCYLPMAGGPGGWFGAEITTTGGDIFVSFTVTVKAQVKPVYFNILVDTDYFATSAPEGLAWIYADSTNVGYATVCINRLIGGPGITAGTHAVKLVWKVGSGGTATLLGDPAVGHGFAHTVTVEEV